MHFITFPVASTNIFPLVNSKNGGQDMSEFNIKSVNSVSTDPNVKYNIGPSYTHSMQDFEVSLLSGMDAPTYNSTLTYNVGDYCVYNDITYVCIYPVITPGAFNAANWNKVIASTSILQISSGKGVINGHYFESLSPVSIDLTLANAQLKQASQPTLSGELSIGLRTYYSTETTMMGSMLVENEDNMYLGVQVVILPKGEFITPQQSPTDRNAVTADLKLADFVYINGAVSSSSITQNPNKVSFLPAERIGNFENVLSTNYISKATLDPNKLYVYSGLNGSDDNNGWCQAVDSLMVWDKTPIGTDTVAPTESEATFSIDTNGQVHLRIPHKQIHRTNTAGDPLYYRTKDLPLPVANYASGTPGTVTAEYTQKIKDIAEKITTYKTFVNGKQITYIDQFTNDEDKTTKLNTIDLSDVNVGDYIIVRQDYTALDISSAGTGIAPSTMYVVLPGALISVKFVGTNKPTDGIRLGEQNVIWQGDNQYINSEDFVGDGTTNTFTLSGSVFSIDNVSVMDTFIGDGVTTTYQLTYEIATDEDIYVAVDGSPVSDSSYTVSGASEITFNDPVSADSTIQVTYPISSTEYQYNPDNIEKIVMTNAPAVDMPIRITYVGLSSAEVSNTFAYTSLRGSTGDYFEIDYYNSTGTMRTSYYWVAQSDNLKSWSDSILITGGIQYATTDSIGGFLNVDTTATDQGYVYRDDSGRLRLLDYSLLRSGTLAYQLGEDYTIPQGQDATTVQLYLDEYVNSRIAFPFTNTLGSVPNMIDIYINLPEVSTTTSINIYNIDSRFGTGVYLHFLGAGSSNLVINIIDCEKIRIDPNIDQSAGTPIINVIRSNLYYDASVISYIRRCDVNYIRSSSFTGMLDISLWYDKFYDTDPDIMVNGMEVSQPNVPMTSEDIDFWSKEISNDNHYGVALRSITFDGSGNIVECSLYVSNNTTLTNTDKPSIVGGSFNIPQGSDLNYPVECITHALKITGTFTTAYYSTTDNVWVVSNTSFTALSGIYDRASGISSGTISFYSIPDMVPPTYTNVTVIDGWTPGTYHIFYGGTTV